MAMQRFTTIHFMLTETCSQNIETCSQKPVVGTSSCTSSCQLYSYRAYKVNCRIRDKIFNANSFERNNDDFIDLITLLE